MLSESAFEVYAFGLKMARKTVEFLQSIRCGAGGKPAPPVRRVGSHRGNLNVRYPSRKMGFVVECESGRAEYYAALHFEHSLDFLEYYSQPATLTLHYTSGKGRAVTVRHVPDYLALEKDVAGPHQLPAHEPSPSPAAG